MRDDYQPHVWRTADFGKTWTEIGQGLRRRRQPHDLREPPQRQSFRRECDGASYRDSRRWLRLGKGLPNVPVEQDRDVVCPTRSDRGDARTRVVGAPAGPLEELGDSTLGEAAHLFGVSPAYQYREADTYPKLRSRPFTAYQSAGRGITTHSRTCSPTA